MDSTASTPFDVMAELFPMGPQVVPPITTNLAIFLRLVHCERDETCPVASYRMEHLHNPPRTVRTVTSYRETNKVGMALVNMEAQGFFAEDWLGAQSSASAIAIGETWRYKRVNHDSFKTAHLRNGITYFAQFAHEGYRPFVTRHRHHMSFGTVTDVYVRYTNLPSLQQLARDVIESAGYEVDLSAGHPVVTGPTPAEEAHPSHRKKTKKRKRGK